MTLRDVVRVTVPDMTVHLVASGVTLGQAQAMVALGRARNGYDLYGHLPAGRAQDGTRWRVGLRRLGVTAAVRRTQ